MQNINNLSNDVVIISGRGCICLSPKLVNILPILNSSQNAYEKEPKHIIFSPKVDFLLIKSWFDFNILRVTGPAH